ncbi:MAG: glucose 1-dehydrogenase [Myxococcota bacterium]|nr:glucose 1-dehydrogenase [Myxococcota bacterium]
MPGLVADKVGLVSGAASGIGRATALALAREGARVLLADVDAERGEAAAEAVRAAGGEARFQRTDVRDAAQVEAMVAAAVDAFGRLDCAVNNAGVTALGGALPDISLEDWQDTIAINLTGVFLAMKFELPVMQRQGGGAVVNMASGAGLVATPGLAHYCASKHGILGLTKTAALENARTGVRVNAICPGSTDTPMLQGFLERAPEARPMILASQPGGRLGTPEEIAEAAVWLCSDRASFVTGESMLVDGGAVCR